MFQRNNQQLQGENVHFCLLQEAGVVKPATPVVLLDSNWNVRVLAPFERLIVDSVGASYTGTIAVPFIFLNTSSTNNPDASTLIATLPSTGGFVWFPKEGISLPVGVTPFVLLGGAAGNRTALSVRFYGEGRIVEGSTQGVHPNWEQSFTPGGIP